MTQGGRRSPTEVANPSAGAISQGPRGLKVVVGRIWRFLHANEETALNPDPFDLVKRDFVAGAVVELGCARGLVCGHGLGILKGAAGLDRASGKAIQS